MHIDVLKTPSGFLKLWEIAITIIIISVSQGVENFGFGGERRTFFCGGVFVMSLVVTPLLLITYLRGAAREIQRTPFELLMNLVLAVFMVSAGAVTINTSFKYYKSLSKVSDACKAVGSFGVINGVFYGLDAYFAHQNMD